VPGPHARVQAAAAVGEHQSRRPPGSGRAHPMHDRRDASALVVVGAPRQDCGRLARHRADQSQHATMAADHGRTEAWHVAELDLTEPLAQLIGASRPTGDPTPAPGLSGPGRTGMRENRRPHAPALWSHRSCPKRSAGRLERAAVLLRPGSWNRASVERHLFSA